jgi:peptide-methionine (S)-S-oxide reductase
MHRLSLGDMFFGRQKSELVDAADALPGRPQRPFSISPNHAVLGTPIEGPFPAGSQQIIVGMGCFWGAERKFWEVPGVYTTAVGYAGWYTPNPTYEETCSGRTGHTEAVLVVFDPAEVSLEKLLAVFWESHDPTQGMRQGNDAGTQYRSAIYTTTPEQAAAAEASKAAYQAELQRKGFRDITTEIAADRPSGTPRTTTSSTSTRSPTATAAWAARACPAPSGSAGSSQRPGVLPRTQTSTR